MADEKTGVLEQKIRDKAVREYREQLTKASEAFIKAMDITNWMELNISTLPRAGENFKRLTPRDVVREIVDQVVKKREADIGATAVANFLSDFEKMQGQIEDLEYSVSNNG